MQGESALRFGLSMAFACNIFKESRGKTRRRFNALLTSYMQNPPRPWGQRG